MLIKLSSCFSNVNLLLTVFMPVVTNLSLIVLSYNNFYKMTNAKQIARIRLN